MSWLKVTSESRMSALRRRCALVEGLICFFTLVPARLLGISNNSLRVRVCTHHRRNPLLPQNAKLHQDFLENFSPGDGFHDSSRKKMKLNGTILREFSGFIAESSRRLAPYWTARKRYAPILRLVSPLAPCAMGMSHVRCSTSA